jgi:hypothetical protein
MLREERAMESDKIWSRGISPLFSLLSNCLSSPQSSQNPMVRCELRANTPTYVQKITKELRNVNHEFFKFNNDQK